MFWLWNTGLGWLPGWPEDLKKKSPSFFKKKPKQSLSQKRPKYLQQRSIWKPKTSTSNHFWNLKISTTNHFLDCLFRWNCNKFVAQKCHRFCWLFHLFKKWLRASKSSQIGKKCLIWSPCSLQMFHLHLHYNFSLLLKTVLI